MAKIKNIIKNLSDLEYIIFSSIFAFISVIPFILLKKYLNIAESSSNLENISIHSLLILIVIIVPLIETIIILLLLKILNKFIKNSLISVYITSILFSLGHYQNIVYIFQMIIPSFIFISSYALRKYKKLSPFFSTFLIHSLFNFYPFLLFVGII